MRKILAIGWANTRRFLRQRANLFFVFVFPVLLILLLGMMYGGGMGTRVGVHVAGSGGDLAARLVRIRKHGVKTALRRTEPEKHHRQHVGQRLPARPVSDGDSRLRIPDRHGEHRLVTQIRPRETGRFRCRKLASRRTAP